jgi:hypothetical protein
MQNAEEADLGSVVLGVGGNLKHGLSAGAEEQIVEAAVDSADRAGSTGGAR